MKAEPTRCGWCTSDPLYIDYHDREWGVPVHDDRTLFEMICLEGAQAGLSWITVLKKRARYREVFDGFDIDKCAAMTDDELEARLLDPGIIRNRLKVYAVRKNALAAKSIIDSEGSLDAFLWSFVGGKPIVNRWKTLREVPAVTDEAIAMSKALKKRGMTFVGPTICYAFMQAVGMVDDHVADCFRSSR